MACVAAELVDIVDAQRACKRRPHPGRLQIDNAVSDPPTWKAQLEAGLHAGIRSDQPPVDPESTVEARSRDANARRTVGARERMGSAAATVIWTGRVLLRTYLAGFAHDGW